MLVLAVALLLALTPTLSQAVESPATTEPATNVGATTAKRATLNGVIDTGGHETFYVFQYGTTEAYGSETESYTIPPGAKAPVPVSIDVDNLKPSTTYHFRIGAFITATGVFYGGDRTFTTSSAHVPQFGAETYPSSVLANTEQTIGGAQEYFKIPALSRNVECTKATFAGVLAAPTASLSLAAGYAGTCKAGGTLATSVQMNGCHYVLNANNTDPAYTGKLDIACNKTGEAIELTVSSSLCVIKIGAQQALQSVALQTTGVGALRAAQAQIGLAGIEYTMTSNNKLVCTKEVGTKTYTDGEYVANLSLRAFDGSLKQVGMFINGEKI